MTSTSIDHRLWPRSRPRRRFVLGGCLAAWIGLLAALPSSASGAPERYLAFFREPGQLQVLQGSAATIERLLPQAAVIRADEPTRASLEGAGLRLDRLPVPEVVYLRDGPVDLTIEPGEEASAPASEEADGGGSPTPWLMAFDGPVDGDRVGSLVAAGAVVVGPVPPYGFLVRADAATRQALEALPTVSAVAPYTGSRKIADRLAPGAGPVRAEVITFAGAPAAPVIGALAPGELVGSHPVGARSVVVAELTAGGLARVAALPEVEWIDIVAFGEPFNHKIRVVMQTDRAHYLANQAFYNPVYGIGVYGAGQIVAVADTGFYVAHEAYQAPAKVLAHYPAANSCAVLGDEVDHGTEVASTFAGDSFGPTSGTWGWANGYDGFSLRSQLVLQDVMGPPYDFCTPKDQVVDLFEPAFAQGARVHNNSWGHNVDETMPQNGRYSLITQELDRFLKQEPFRESVQVFAAGNYGHDWSSQAYVPRSLSDEAHSKNAVVVGGGGNGNARHLMYFWSSRGPTSDCNGEPCTGGPRVKPDLVAPAFGVTSASVYTNDPTYYRPNNSGTSFGAPAVSAAAALVRDYFAQGIYPTDSSDPPLVREPSSALIKAMLVNASVFLSDEEAFVGNPPTDPDAYPNFDQGYGRPVLDNVLEPAGYRELKVYENDTTEAETGSVWSRSLAFKDRYPASCKTLRVTLAWTDEPMTLGAGQALVNDLDLEVDLGGARYLGNHLREGGLVRDRANNVEDVIIPFGDDEVVAPAGLQAVVRVIGSSVLTADPQPFAVVVTYGACFDNIPCPPPPSGPGGCYRGPQDIVPRPGYEPPPSCTEQFYSQGECVACSSPYPVCEPEPPVEEVDAAPLL